MANLDDNWRTSCEGVDGATNQLPSPDKLCELRGGYTSLWPFINSVFLDTHGTFHGLFLKSKILEKLKNFGLSKMVKIPRLGKRKWFPQREESEAPEAATDSTQPPNESLSTQSAVSQHQSALSISHRTFSTGGLL